MNSCVFGSLRFPLKYSMPGSLSPPILCLPPSLLLAPSLSTSLAPSLSLGPFSFHPHAKSNHHLRGNGWSCDLHLFLWLVATRWSHLAPHTRTYTHKHTSSLGCLQPSLPPSFFMASLLVSIPSSPLQLSSPLLPLF